MKKSRAELLNDTLVGMLNVTNELAAELKSVSKKIHRAVEKELNPLLAKNAKLQQKAPQHSVSKSSLKRNGR